MVANAMSYVDLHEYSEADLLIKVHEILAKPGEVTRQDEKDLRVINQELLWRQRRIKG